MANLENTELNIMKQKTVVIGGGGGGWGGLTGQGRGVETREVGWEVTVNKCEFPFGVMEHSKLKLL